MSTKTKKNKNPATTEPTITTTEPITTRKSRGKQAHNREEIYPNIWKVIGTNGLYIRLPNGQLKYASTERFEKLMAKADNNPSRVVSEYRVRNGKMN